MKQLLSAFLALFLCASLTGCRNIDPNSPDGESTPFDQPSSSFDPWADSWINSFFQAFSLEPGAEQTVKTFCKNMKRWNRAALAPFVMSDDEITIALGTVRLTGEILSWIPFALLNASLRSAPYDFRSTPYEFDLLTEIVNLSRESAGKIRYKIVEVVQDGNVSDVTVEFTYPDLTAALEETGKEFSNVFSHIFPELTSFSLEMGNATYPESWDESFFEVFKSKAKTAPYQQEEVLFHCAKEENRWVIESVPSEDIERILWCYSKLSN